MATSPKPIPRPKPKASSKPKQKPAPKPIQKYQPKIVLSPKEPAKKPVSEPIMLKKNFRPPNMEGLVPNGEKKYVSYMEGAKHFSLNYYSFVKLAKRAGANMKIKKSVVVDLERVTKYIENNCKGDSVDVFEEES